MTNVTIGVPVERAADEHRVALVPTIVESLVGDGFRVLVEGGAGVAAGYSDEAYVAAGAELVGDAAATHAGATLIARVSPPAADELASLTAAHTVISLLDPLGDVARTQRLAETGATLFAFEFMPRTTRAQAMDAL